MWLSVLPNISVSDALSQLIHFRVHVQIISENLRDWLVFGAVVPCGWDSQKTLGPWAQLELEVSPGISTVWAEFCTGPAFVPRVTCFADLRLFILALGFFHCSDRSIG